MTRILQAFVVAGKHTTIKDIYHSMRDSFDRNMQNYW